MINSLYISITGKSAFGDQLAVSSNNIANSETTAFKSSEITFADLLASPLLEPIPIIPVAAWKCRR
jgi:flagellar hook protein FlgE